MKLATRLSAFFLAALAVILIKQPRSKTGHYTENSWRSTNVGLLQYPRSRTILPFPPCARANRIGGRVETTAARRLGKIEEGQVAVLGVSAVAGQLAAPPELFEDETVEARRFDVGPETQIHHDP